MVVLKCHGCGSEKAVSKPPREFWCKVCGACNIVPLESEGYGDEACGCIVPKGFEWQLPSGVHESASGEKMYSTAQGTLLPKKDFMQAYKFDPDISWARMRELGINGRAGFKNLSTLGKRKPK